MSGTSHTKVEKKLKTWLKITSELLHSADEDQLNRISNRLNSFLKRVCSHSTVMIVKPNYFTVRIAKQHILSAKNISNMLIVDCAWCAISTL